MNVFDIDQNRPFSPYNSYLEESRVPLVCFLFTLPLFLVYHGGLWWLKNFSGLRWANAADIVIAQALGEVGMAGPLLSFLFVVTVFLVLQIWSKQPWRRPRPSTWFLMLLESMVFSAPVFFLSRLVTRLVDATPLWALSSEVGGSSLSWQSNLVLSCGAGVYEEFLFRLVLMSLMGLFWRYIIGLEGGWLFTAAVLGQALLFASFHHLPGGPEAIGSFSQLRAVLPVFSFRTLAGVYFGFLYLERGFGIAAGAHAGYDLMVVLLDMLYPGDDMF